MLRSGTKFHEIVKNEISRKADIFLTDNEGYQLFQDFVYRPGIKGRINNLLKWLMPSRYYYQFVFNYRFSKHMDGLAYLYDRLRDVESKLLLTQVLAYRVLGYTKYALPLRNPEYIKSYSLAETLISDKNDFIDPEFRNIILYRHQLGPLGYDIAIYFASLGVVTDFIVKQYEYRSSSCTIKAEENDVVIDAGGCWGDTALYFAHEVGENGKIFSFEFISGNIAILKKNLSINPLLEKRVELVKNPVWEKSGIKLYHNNLGPASRVSGEKFPGATEETKTVAIDDLVRNRGIKKVGFIKMDIEGAELSALKGAAATIVGHMPKLAISVYHSISDFYTIPAYIDSLGVPYEFYFKHATIHGGESVLFGRPALAGKHN